MKQKPDSNTKQGHSTNMLLYAVAPQPKLSTDAIALDGAVVPDKIPFTPTNEL